MSEYDFEFLLLLSDWQWMRVIRGFKMVSTREAFHRITERKDWKS